MSKATRWYGTCGLVGFSVGIWQAAFHPTPMHFFTLAMYPVAFMLGRIWSVDD